MITECIKIVILREYGLPWALMVQTEPATAQETRREPWGTNHIAAKPSQWRARCFLSPLEWNEIP